ncbi:MAG: DUF3179 domain-containing protein [Deltaproteobacteria bacterium]
MRTLLATLIIFLTAITLLAEGGLAANQYNGFDVSNSLIPKDEIFSGGPPRDGIPAILNPKFESAEKASGWLNDSDLVAGIDDGSVQKTYPLRILVWHEAVNDTVGGRPVLVSYCPLCGSTLIFSREIDGRTLSFGISGLLYQSDVLFYDHQTESLWSQLEMKAVSGKMAGTEFDILPSTLATWGEWKEKHPGTLVLSRDTGFSRDYGNQPYSGYERSASVMFPIKHKSDRFHPKEKVLVVLSGGDVKAYPFSELEKTATPLKDELGGRNIVIKYEDGKYVGAYDEADRPVKSFVTYWFAWYTFRPDTPVFSSAEDAG